MLEGQVEQQPIVHVDWIIFYASEFATIEVTYCEALEPPGA